MRYKRLSSIEMETFIDGGYCFGVCVEGIMINCKQCGDPTFKDFCECGACQRFVCKECLISCDICKLKEEYEDIWEIRYCGDCLASCDACEDLTICVCIGEHLKTCTYKSRNERIVSSETYSIQECEKRIDKLEK